MDAVVAAAALGIGFVITLAVWEISSAVESLRERVDELERQMAEVAPWLR